MSKEGPRPGSWDVLVVGAGPTGLALAAQLHAHGSTVLVVDQNRDRAMESRALAVQPRTLEVLRPFHLSYELVRRGNPAATLLIHAGSRVVRTRLFDIGVDDSEFPFVLFVSQAETEGLLGDYLASEGVPVHRGLRMEDVAQAADGCTSTLRDSDGTAHEVRTKYVVGCDGAHSTVRELAGIAFVGGRYPQTFLLADLHANGLESDTLNAFLTDTGPFLFFPLDRPAPWRIISMRPSPQSTDEQMGNASVSASHVSLQELQELADVATNGTVRLHDVVWATAFRLHHRHAAKYRSRRMFLAGDAAHIHSPAGAQGMNTGIQDAINLGWKLALVCRGIAPEALLDSYDAERRPVGKFVLRFTDRAFRATTSNAAIPRLLRGQVVPRVLRVTLRFRTGRAFAFRTVSQLAIRYRSGSAIEPSHRWMFRRRLRPGDRLPDAQVERDGTPTRLQEALGGHCFHLLIAGPPSTWSGTGLSDIPTAHGDLVAIHWLSRDPRSGALHDPSGEAHRRLGIRGAGAVVVRPDGYIGCRADEASLDVIRHYLSRMLT
jgi:2-polyprenyl-6-methoxyphenol hydroxylase-like FAD-dependent oxidoreductase